MADFNPTYEEAVDVLEHFDVRENVGLSSEEVMRFYRQMQLIFAWENLKNLPQATC